MSEPAAAPTFDAWLHHLEIEDVCASEGCHTLHAYFNCSPERPDGREVLFYRSRQGDAMRGELVARKRETGEETVLAADLSVEDPHRAALQQWAGNGRRVVYHRPGTEGWEVVVADARTGEALRVVPGRQLGVGNGGEWVPLCAAPGNPGGFRDVELLNVSSGEIRRAVRAERIRGEHEGWVEERCGTAGISLYFPVLSPDGARVFFKLAVPDGAGGSRRMGLVVAEIHGEGGCFRWDDWGHPAWHPDSRHIVQPGAIRLDAWTGDSAWMEGFDFPRQGHPAVGPDGRLLVCDTVTDAGPPFRWGIFLTDVEAARSAQIYALQPEPGEGARRSPHPHPVFNATGDAIYLNACDGRFWRLYRLRAGTDSGGYRSAKKIRRARRWLNIPIRSGDCFEMAVVRIRPEEGLPIEFPAEVAREASHWTANVDLGTLAGRPVEISMRYAYSPEPPNIELLALSDEPQGVDGLYREPLRPRFHFTCAKGWLNDPNGMVYFDGWYHLFYQHCPFDHHWAFKCWGHAMSRDLVHWQPRPPALLPDEAGQIYSGSGAVDWENSTGWGEAGIPPLVLAYTAAGGRAPASSGRPFTQGLAVSRDGGLSWEKAPRNPLLGSISRGNRDPKVLWHRPTRAWIMVLFAKSAGEDRFLFLRSPDLRKWEIIQEIAGLYECPDFFEIRLEGTEETRWVLTDAKGRYLVGRFDGRRFEPEEGPHALCGEDDFYAGQTFSDAPDGRMVQIGWLRNACFPQMPFSQQLSVPRELTLRRTADGLRLFQWPVEELAALRQPLTGMMLPERGAAWRAEGLPGASFDAVFRLKCGGDAEMVFTVNGLEFSVAPGRAECRSGGRAVRHWKPADPERIGARVLADRGSVEVFLDGGAAAFSFSRVCGDAEAALGFCANGPVEAEEAAVYALNSIWPQAARNAPKDAG